MSRGKASGQAQTARSPELHERREKRRRCRMKATATVRTGRGGGWGRSADGAPREGNGATEKGARNLRATVARTKPNPNSKGIRKSQKRNFKRRLGDTFKRKSKATGQKAAATGATAKTPATPNSKTPTEKRARTSRGAVAQSKRSPGVTRG